MQLAILIAVLAALASAEAGGGPVTDLASRLMLAMVAPLIAPLAALVGAPLIRMHAAQGHDANRHYGRLYSVVVGLWLAGVLVMLLVAQWPRIVAGNWQLKGWPLLDELAVLAPIVLSLMFVWAALYRVARMDQLAECRDQGLAPPPPQLFEYLWLHVRHELALVLAPPLVIIAVVDCFAALGIAENNLDAAWWLVLPLLLTMLLLLPAAVRRLWRTTPLPAGALRDLLTTVCAGQNCRVREILVWHTGGAIANAAVVGLSRWLRYVLLSDALLARLTASEVAAVVRHEVAHLSRWHLPLRLALLVLPLAAWEALQHGWHGWPEFVSAGMLANFGGGMVDSTVTALAAPLLLLAYAFVVVGRYSRFLEHDADLEACLAANGKLDPLRAADFSQALAKVCSDSPGGVMTHWLHPSLADRLRLLSHAVVDERRAKAFRRSVSLVAAAIFAAYAAIAVLAILAAT